MAEAFRGFEEASRGIQGSEDKPRGGVNRLARTIVIGVALPTLHKKTASSPKRFEAVSVAGLRLDPLTILREGRCVPLASVATRGSPLVAPRAPLGFRSRSTVALSAIASIVVRRPALLPRGLYQPTPNRTIAGALR